MAAGADALAVKTDAEDTAEPLKDLLTVTQSALAASRRCVGAGLIAAEAAVPPPVLQRDWFIHPLQVGRVCFSQVQRSGSRAWWWLHGV